jgi:ubiquinone/menaquinone biosynthesis C-methylase UbiE
MSALDPLPPATAPAKTDGIDHSSDPNFLAYYESQSLAPATVERFRTVRDKALRLLRERERAVERLRVADIGCGAGTQAFLWAELGHSVCGLDINEPLISVARRRAAEQGVPIRFDVGTATALPYADAAFDVCLLPELLEHVPDWEGCLREAARVLAPGGVFYVSTTNALCPKQEEFNLPLYSWYPRFLKRRYERLAVTTRPELANFAKYPAVHWFTFYQLRAFLQQFGFECLDRFDMIDDRRLPTPARLAVQLTRSLPPLRFAGYVVSGATAIFALKRGNA